MTAPSKPNRALIGVLILVAYAAHALLRDAFFESAGGDDDDLDDYDRTGGGSKPWPSSSSQFAEPPSFPLSSPSRNESNGYDFSVLIISYHKTGHDLQMDLVDFLQSHFGDVGPRLTKHGNESPLKGRRHSAKTPCARPRLETGKVLVQHAPDLFCSPTELAQWLLNGGTGHAEGERGVKVVHLVRNPFEMAVSNYHYHNQVPTPEPWVMDQNPCETGYDEKGITKSFGQMIMPAMTKTKIASMNLNFGEPLFTMAEFDDIVEECLSLYRANDELKEATFLDHLRSYDSIDGLLLATAQMTVQGHENGGDILRMAHNVLELKRAQVAADTARRHAGRDLRVSTMSLDDFVTDPAGMAYRFFDFVLSDDATRTTRASHVRKEAAAREYEIHYREKMEGGGGSMHATRGKYRDTEQLKEYLRHDEVFGKPLGKIEMLVETSLEESRRGG